MNWLRLIAGLFVTALFGALVIHHTDWPVVRELWARASGSLLAVAVSLFACDLAVRTLRWGRMLQIVNPDLRWSEATWPFLVGVALNNVLPFRIGDVVRVLGFRSRLGSRGADIAATLLVERLLDAMALLLFFFAGLLIANPAAVPDSIRIGIASLTAAGLVAAVAVISLPTHMQRWSRWMLGAPPLARIPGIDQLTESVDRLLSTLQLLGRPSTAANLGILSIVAWALEGGVFWFVAMSLSTDAAGVGAWFSMALGTLATLIPSAPGYLGTFDYFAMLGFIAFGVDQSTAAASALLTHIVIWLPPTVVGGIYFLIPAHRFLRTGLARTKEVL